MLMSGGVINEHNKEKPKMVLNTMIATGNLMLEKDMSYEEVVSRVATKGGITEEGTKVIYREFPETMEELFKQLGGNSRLFIAEMKALFFIVLFLLYV